MVGDDIIQVVQDFLRSGKLLKEVNSTAITLIIESKCPTNVGDFRPISRCNMLYKCIKKVLRNILPDIINENKEGLCIAGI